MCPLPAQYQLDIFSICRDLLACIFFSHVLHFPIIMSFIASCFITFMLLYGFLVSLDHLRSFLCFSGKAL